MDIKNKANDIKIDKLPFSVMPKLVERVNVAITNGAQPDIKLIWSQDLEYEVVEYDGSIYKDKALEYGADSLYILIRIDRRIKDSDKEKNNPRNYSVLAVWQNKKFLGNADTSYKSITAILNNNFSYRTATPTWLIIKNPKIVDYSYRKDYNPSPQQQKNKNINKAYKEYAFKAKEIIKAIKESVVGTKLENDNPLEITKKIVDLMFATPNQRNDIKDKELENYLQSSRGTFAYYVKGYYSNLISTYIEFIKVTNPENPINQFEITETRKNISEKIKTNKEFPEKPDGVEVIDKSGYVINLSKWLEKKWDKFKNSNNLLDSLIYKMQSEYNDLIFETKVTIRELVASDEKEDWMKVEKFSNYIVYFKNSLDRINRDIEQFIDYYKQNNEPIDTSSWTYKNIITKIKEFITEVRAQKQEII
jgi:hypothetical protein